MAADEPDSLESILNRATNPANRDENWDSIVAFCDQVNKELEGPQIAVRLIAHKIQSPQEREALHTLTTLESCVKNCGRRFHLEIGKFRFLNEMIKVVSPKYLGQHTTEKVKNRCIEILYSWSTGLKHEPKIAEAYAMLKRQGIVKQDPVHIDKTYEPPPPPRAKNAVFEDEDKSKLLARLLRSKHPEDLQAANRLIKNMVKQDAERMDKVSRRMQQLETINNSVKLLNEMLTHFDRGSASEADTDVMKELYENLEKTRPNLFRLASDTDEKDTEGINEILQMSDTVMKTMQMYKRVVDGVVEENGYIGSASTSNKAGSNLCSLLDLDLSTGAPSSSSGPACLPRPPSGGCRSAGADSLDDSSLLGGKPQSDIDMLGDLFGTPAASNNVVDPFGSVDTATTSEEFGALSMAPPTSSTIPGFAQFPSAPPMFQAPPASSAPTAPTATAVTFPVIPPAPAPSSQPALFSDSSITTGSSSAPQAASNSAAPASVFGVAPPMTASPVLLPSVTSSASSASTSQTAQPEPSSKSGLDDLDILGQSLQEFSLTPEKKPLQPSGAPAAKIPMNQLAASSSTSTTNPTLRSLTGELIPTPTGSATSSPIKKLSNTEIQPLTDIFVPLENIKPGTLQPLIAYDKNDIKTMIHFAKDTPRPDVLVMVVSTMSTNENPIKAFIFQSAVPKSMRVKLQPPSATDLPAHNPILPPAAITQVMLIANPHKEKIRLKYKVSYKLNEATVTDVGDVDNFPVQ